MKLKPSESATAGSLVACPKCGWEQEQADECLRCGIVFAKYKPSFDPGDEPTSPVRTVESRSASPGLGWRLFRLLPWISLTITGGVLLLILKQTPPLTIQTDPQVAEHVAEKIARLQLAMESGRAYSLSLNEAELNQWMRDNLAIASAQQANEAGLNLPPGHQPTAQEVQSALKDVRINMIDHQLRAYALFTIYGRDISLQLDGTLESEDGVLRLKPISGKLGSLPIPRSTLDHVVQRLFDSPQNRDNFKLPPQIASVWIENSTLVVVTR
jgi:hypothetical protein